MLAYTMSVGVETGDVPRRCYGEIRGFLRAFRCPIARVVAESGVVREQLDRFWVDTEVAPQRIEQDVTNEALAK